MRLRLVTVLAVLAFGLRSDATVYATQDTSYREWASDWMSGFLSLRVRTHDQRYDGVIKELMKVQCEGGNPEDSLHRLEAIDRTPVDSLLPLDAWNDSYDVLCGCFVHDRNYDCGAVWDGLYELRQ
jgi:hypothetical protein